jgi:FMN phosphatase YigB (HAD superfamily)
MSTGYQIKDQEGLYYLTFQVVDWIDKLEYLHQNPIRSGIVSNPEDYMYSIARNYADLENLLEVELLSLPAIVVK